MDFIRSLAHPDEIVALLRFRFGGGRETITPSLQEDSLSPNMKKCVFLLKKTSRSFAAVIQALDEELRHPVCIFYLVLRALDTVEDDMTIPLATKVPLLKTFYTRLEDPEWKYTESQEKDRIVLEDFPVISAEYRALAPSYRQVISDICRRMGEGMTEYLEQHPDTEEDWDKYCHYVAGLVGIGLSQLFAASGLENEQIGKEEKLANAMGLFLQKTNIIRDYLEDINDGRIFWPKSVWKKFTLNLEDFKSSEHSHKAVACLNYLVTNALQHAPDVLEYMSKLKNRSVFNFCSIPQVMAIGTLARCYNNHQVFTGVVKIRKGEAVRMMMEATDMNSFKKIMSQCTQELGSEIPFLDPSAVRTLEIVQRIMTLCSPEWAGLCMKNSAQSGQGIFGALKRFGAAFLILAMTWSLWSPNFS
ncbi:squalene synthase-like [Oscarella lobularis]|uniref:squalene synthase-like n=1 Tax=Oscarella lobularis TaxID=121494 RepID=UPI0033137598